MANDDGASVVSFVSSVESVVTVVESVEVGRVEDEVDHTVEQGSLLFSKIEFSIKPDLRGLSFS